MTDSTPKEDLVVEPIELAGEEAVNEAGAEVSVAETQGTEPDDDAAITVELEKLKAAQDPAQPTPIAPPEKKKRMPIGLKVFLWLLALLLLATAAAAGWVLWTDYEQTDIIPEGISFGGLSMAGYTSQQAQNKVKETVAGLNLVAIQASLESIPATSTFRTGEPQSDIGELVIFDPEQAVREIVDARGQSDLITRARHDFLGEPIIRDVKLTYSISEDHLDSYIESLSTHYQSKTVNAKISQSKGEIQLRQSKEGYAPDPAASKESARAAILSYLDDFNQSTGDIEFDFVGKTLKPKIPTAKLEKTPVIIVSLSRHRVTLYNGEKVVKSYPCAIGTPSHPTPTGDWKITAKRRNPVWRNPGSAWAKDMPASIGPSPSSPLGSRALNLDATNIRLHGTTNIGSVGTAASHGCLRMYNGDIIDLFDRVNVGTQVFIIR